MFQSARATNVRFRNGEAHRRARVTATALFGDGFFDRTGATAMASKGDEAGARVDNRRRSPERAAVWRAKLIRIIRIAS